MAQNRVSMRKAWSPLTWRRTCSFMAVVSLPFWPVVNLILSCSSLALSPLFAQSEVVGRKWEGEVDQWKFVDSFLLGNQNSKCQNVQVIEHRMIGQRHSTVHGILLFLFLVKIETFNQGVSHSHEWLHSPRPNRKLMELSGQDWVVNNKQSLYLEEAARTLWALRGEIGDTILCHYQMPALSIFQSILSNWRSSKSLSVENKLRTCSKLGSNDLLA